ncbi:MAG: ribosome biogenesis GTP-binding protein YihA/YsxC [Oscillospiraceae bacterium]|jgi:GTP-binding protein|nr:ribosome biogenesis GTP-binding protein YihA/YsxC [Oscillospiraceae bacterium]
MNNNNLKINFNNPKLEISAGDVFQLPADNLPEIVFSGKSNVGKSSIINKIINRKSFARVSNTPGKTSTINFYNTGVVRLVDLPGYGYAKRSFSEKKRWSELVQSYFLNRKNITLVVQIIDIRHLPSLEDLQMVKYLIDSQLPFVVSLNKIDKLNKTQREIKLSKINSELKYNNINVLVLSSKTGENIETLRQIICSSVQLLPLKKA